MGNVQNYWLVKKALLDFKGSGRKFVNETYLTPLSESDFVKRIRRHINGRVVCCLKWGNRHQKLHLKLTVLVTLSKSFDSVQILWLTELNLLWSDYGYNVYTILCWEWMYQTQTLPLAKRITDFRYTRRLKGLFNISYRPTVSGCAPLYNTSTSLNWYLEQASPAATAEQNCIYSIMAYTKWYFIRYLVSVSIFFFTSAKLRNAFRKDWAIYVTWMSSYFRPIMSFRDIW